MADINPISSSGTSGYTTAAWDRFYYDPVQNTTATLTENRRQRIQAPQILTYYFADADNGEDFSGVRGMVACAWQANGTDDQVAPLLHSTADGVRLATAATNPKGWLHVMVRGNFNADGGTDEAPVAKGTAGYVDPARGIFLCDRNATPDTLTDASSEKRIKSKLGYKFQVIPFATTDTSDLWKCTTGTRGTDTLCPGIVAVAWQASVAGTSSQVAATLDANSDVVFTAPAGSGTGWLWVWRARS